MTKTTNTTERFNQMLERAKRTYAAEVADQCHSRNNHRLWREEFTRAYDDFDNWPTPDISWIERWQPASAYANHKF